MARAGVVRDGLARSLATVWLVVATVGCPVAWADPDPSHREVEIDPGTIDTDEPDDVDEDLGPTPTESDSDPADPVEDASGGPPSGQEIAEGVIEDAATRPENRTLARFRELGVEIGTRYRLGIGIAAGFPPSVTLRYAADPRRAVALHVGPTMVTTGLHVRLQYEQRVAELRTWAFGTLGLTWNIGVVASLVFGQEVDGRPIRPGITTGLGVELAFGVAPAAVFGEISPVLYPLDLFPATRTAFLPAGLTVVVGARWYLDVGRRGRRRP